MLVSAVEAFSIFHAHDAVRQQAAQRIHLPHDLVELPVDIDVQENSARNHRRRRLRLTERIPSRLRVRRWHLRWAWRPAFRFGRACAGQEHAHDIDRDRESRVFGTRDRHQRVHAKDGQPRKDDQRELPVPNKESGRLAHDCGSADDRDDLAVAQVWRAGGDDPVAGFNPSATSTRSSRKPATRTAAALRLALPVDDETPPVSPRPSRSANAGSRGRHSVSVFDRGHDARFADQGRSVGRSATSMSPARRRTRRALRLLWRSVLPWRLPGSSAWKGDRRRVAFAQARDLAVRDGHDQDKARAAGVAERKDRFAGSDHLVRFSEAGQDRRRRWARASRPLRRRTLTRRSRRGRG